VSEKLLKGLRLGSPSNPVVMMLTEYEGHRLLDIRKYFVEKTTKDLKPTRKGVSLNANLAKQVQDVMNNNSEAIFAWLERGDDSALTEVERAMQARTQAAEEEALKPRPFRVKEREWKGAEFFACESNGAEDYVALNTKHPFFQHLQCSQRQTAATCPPIMLLLASYYRAKLRFSGDIEADADQFFQLLEHEWGLLLKNYCQNQNALDHA
jgi:hypothetical protein